MTKYRKSIFSTYPLFTRIGIYILSFALFATCLVSMIHLWFSYTLEIEAIQTRLEHLEQEQVALLTNSMWSFDNKAIDIQLKSILSDNAIVYIEIKKDGVVEYMAGEPHLKDPKLFKTYPLIHLGRYLGEVSFYATSSNVKKQLLMSAAGSLIAQVVGIIFTCFFIVVLLFLLLSKPFSQILKFTDSIQLDNLDADFSLNRSNSFPDELDAIVDTINSMRSRLKRDMEENEQIRHALASEQAFSDAVINSLPGIFFVADESHIILRGNQVFHEHYLTRGRNENINLFTRVDPRDQEALAQASASVLGNSEPVSIETRLLNHQNQSIPYLLNCSRVEQNQTRYLIGIGTNLEERKRIEGDLRQSQKMESIGTLAGGIAHDFNNILSAIFGYTELAKKQVKNPEKLSVYHENIMKAADRARELVRQILTFGRKNEQENVPIQMAMLVRESSEFLRSSIPSTIEIRTDIQSEAIIISDPTQIHQIILNLCTNAYQAMSDTGGIITISLKDVTVTENDGAAGMLLAPGQYVLLEVGDTGPGIPDHVMDNIFEPYFTTKGKGSGTGLGLAVVHGIIQRNKGHLSVASKVGNGAVFSVYLPVSEQAHESDDNDMGEITTDLSGDEHIMVVDDEDSIRTPIRLFLEDSGYTVSDFPDGRQAFEAFEQAPDKYNLIITDMTMPRMNGLQFGQAVLAIRKDIPVILCTGYDENVSRSQSKTVGFSHFVQKPFEHDRLLQDIRRILDQKVRA
ncbi:MAG: response regulator [Desulfobacteraceae bacterium]|nr:MAG: response regulator [Desulfobacteraceae bacterium]